MNDVLQVSRKFVQSCLSSYLLFFCVGQFLFEKGKAVEPLRKSTTFVSLKKNLVSHLDNDANNTCETDFDILTTFYRQIEANISH